MQKKLLMRILTQVLLIGILVVAFAVPAFAYKTFDDHVLLNGINDSNWTMQNPDDLTTTTLYYEDSITDAVDSWCEEAGVGFTQVDFYDPVPVHVYYMVNDFGSTNWKAATFFYDENSNLMNPSAGDPSDDWKFVFIKMNHYYLYDEIDSLSLQSTAAHEMGHALGLAHNTDKSTLMYPYIDRYLDNHIYYPQNDDINGVEFLY